MQSLKIVFKRLKRKDMYTVTGQRTAGNTTMEMIAYVH